MAIQDTDNFIVNRNGTNYRQAASNIMAIQDTDLLLVNRGGTNYKVTGTEVKQYAGVGFSGVFKLSQTTISQAEWLVPYGSSRSSYPDYIVFYPSIFNVQGGYGPQLIKLNGQKPTPDTIISGFTNFGLSNAVGDLGGCLVIAPNRVFAISAQYQNGATEISYRYTSVDIATWNAGVASGTSVSFPGAVQFIQTVTTVGAYFRGWYDPTSDFVYYYYSQTRIGQAPLVTFRVYNANTGALSSVNNLSSPWNQSILQGVDIDNGIAFLYDSTSQELAQWDYRTNALVGTPQTLPFQVSGYINVNSFRALPGSTTGQTAPFGQLYSLSTLQQVYPPTTPDGSLLSFANNSALYNSTPGLYSSVGGATAQFKGGIVDRGDNAYRGPFQLINQVDNVIWSLADSQPNGPALMITY